MKIKNLSIASIVVAVVMSASAQAAVIAGWDFSQFKAPGDPTTGGPPLLATNASLDQNGAGSESGFRSGDHQRPGRPAADGRSRLQL
jgi:hypothetical protein